jgi:Fe-S cluster assembly ATP-binding protein
MNTLKQTLLSVKNLTVAVDDKNVLNGIDLQINSGEFHLIMGPNGSGKSSLSLTLMGHPRYHIQDGSIEFCGQNLTRLKPNERAKLGLFLAMQNPHEIEGVPLKQLLRQAYNQIYDNTNKQLRLSDFNKLLEQKIQDLKLDPSLVERFANVGFSGGEKKKAEILQMAILQPKLAILDEIDSGVDLDAIKVICAQINQIRQNQKDSSFLLITHNPKLLESLTPDFVHVMRGGKIIKSGSLELIKEIETLGFE